MRNKVVLMITALFIFGASINSVANEDPRNSQFAVVQVKGSEVFKVIYKTEVASRVKLNIYNASLRLIFTETLNSDGFIRPLNFTGLTFREFYEQLRSTIRFDEADSPVLLKIHHK